ncbi:MAG: hypothetical protein KBA75_02845 [Alphaproteobacteria bacterium]|nr:hypothetical protein [Alphaproteobacteria bacterium]
MIAPPAPLDTLQREMSELSQMFKSFQRELQQGRPIDLAGMDKRVKDFCDAVENADVTIRKDLLPDFAILLKLLETLETELRAARDRAKQ